MSLPGVGNTEHGGSVKPGLVGKTVVASVSGGKDSAAMSLWLKEQGIEHRRVFLDTGWESNVTYEYLREELPRVIGPIEWTSGPKKMEEIVRERGMFPSRLRRWCTRELKVEPMVAYVAALQDGGADVVNTVGIRKAESAARAAMVAWEFSDTFDCHVWRPLLEWSEQDVIDIHRRHGLKPNPLYLQGATRVGCFPCIFARKSELRMIADKEPSRIDRLRILEQVVGDAMESRAVAKGTTLANRPAWFQNPLSEMSRGADGVFHRNGTPWPIDRVVEWSRTARGGKQLELLAAPVEDQGCMRWGMCEHDQPVGENK